MNQKLVLGISIAIGMVAALLSHQFLRLRMGEVEKEWERFRLGTREVYAVIASRDLAQGTTITQDDIARKTLYEIETTARGAIVTVEEAAQLLKRKTLFRINRGEAIYWRDIEGGGIRERGLSAVVTPGMRAVSLAVGGAAAVSSMVLPDDHVDVLGTFAFPSKDFQGEMESVTLTILQDVTVLATGQRTAHQFINQGAMTRGGYSTLTLEVTPREAELLVFAQQMKGSLYMSLRNAADVSYEQNLPVINFEKLESSLPELNIYRQKRIRGKP